MFVPLLFLLLSHIVFYILKNQKPSLQRHNQISVIQSSANGTTCSVIVVLFLTIVFLGSLGNLVRETIFWNQYFGTEEDNNEIPISFFLCMICFTVFGSTSPLWNSEFKDFLQRRYFFKKSRITPLQL